MKAQVHECSIPPTSCYLYPTLYAFSQTLSPSWTRPWSILTS